jgi:hypothetical protein
MGSHVVDEPEEVHPIGPLAIAKLHGEPKGEALPRSRAQNEAGPALGVEGSDVDTWFLKRHEIP